MFVHLSLVFFVETSLIPSDAFGADYLIGLLGDTLLAGLHGCSDNQLS